MVRSFGEVVESEPGQERPASTKAVESVAGPAVTEVALCLTFDFCSGPPGHFYIIFTLRPICNNKKFKGEVVESEAHGRFAKTDFFVARSSGEVESEAGPDMPAPAFPEAVPPEVTEVTEVAPRTLPYFFCPGSRGNFYTIS